jgi:hypothetical protein
MTMAKRFKGYVAADEDGPYSVLGIERGYPFHCVLSSSNAGQTIDATLFSLSPEDLRGLALAAGALADELEQAQHQDEQPQRSIEEVIR